MNRLQSILNARAAGPAEVILSGTLLAFGISLLNPAVDTFQHYPLYHVMARVAGEIVWGGTFTLVALGRLWSVCFGSYLIRIITAAASMFIWLLLFFSFLFAEPSNPGVLIFCWWAVCDLWTLWRIRVNA